MNQQAAQQYLRTKVLTATPEQLQLMLYDGAIRFCEQGKIALEQKKFDQSYTALSRAQNIIMELTSSLRHQIAPDLCRQLASLYNFVYRKLIEANVQHMMESLDEALGILRYQRETWVMLLDKLSKAKAGIAATRLDMPAPSTSMEASISMQG
jgi:flagellar secretion chaperone FliS